MTKKLTCIIIFLWYSVSQAQIIPDTLITTDTMILHPDTLPDIVPDSLRITNINPYITLHVDSILKYKLEINKDPERYYWFLKNSPVGLQINNKGLLTFKPEKSFFLSNKLKYDQEYKVNIGVQSLDDPTERVDTSFTLLFFNTDIIPSRVKPSVSNYLIMDEGETITFKVQCETGSFPIENILFNSNIPINNFSLVKECNDEFTWTPGYDFVRETDKDKERMVLLHFIGSTRFKVKDTSVVQIIVKNALNYPIAHMEFNQLIKNIRTYTMQLKYSFLQLDKRLKKTKSFRTTFDLTSGTTALAGTILNVSSDPGAQKVGKVLPSVGVAVVPVKEAVAPNKVVEQNQAALIRTSIKRLEYMVNDNYLVGEKDPDVTRKTTKLREELKQIQIQLIDIPVELNTNMTKEELNRYFNSPKVNKKYRLNNK